MIYTFRADEELMKEFDSTVRRVAFLEDRKLTRNKAINEIIKRYISNKKIK